MAGGLLGSKTGDFLTWVTIVMVAVFLVLAVVMGKFYRPEITDYGTAPAVTAPQPTTESPAPAVAEPAPQGGAATGADANGAGL
jgi:preprotein translocase subunit SecG